MAEDFVSCRAAVDLTADQVAQLDALDGAVHEVRQTTSCQLERGHAGAHVACAQDQDIGVTWWAQWTEQTPEIAPADSCPVEAEPGAPYTELCLLPAGHVGGHLF